MEQEQLHERLTKLHAELQQVGAVDAESRALLQKIEDDILALLKAKEDERPSRYKGFGEGLRAGIERLEASHPDLALTMGQLADMLAKMGI
jgi:hypothetical protein